MNIDLVPPDERTPQPVRIPNLEMFRALAKSKPPFEMRRLLLNEDTPRHHYKYMRFDGSPDALRNLKTLMVDSSLYLSSPADFNDPFEFRFKVHRHGDSTAIRRRVRRWLSTAPGWRTLKKRDQEALLTSNMVQLPKVMDDPNTFERHRHGVLCLASDPRDLLMWSHYADSHKGICIQLRTAPDPGIFLAAQLVDYSDVYPTLQWPDMDPDVLKAILTRKSSCWRYENERRIVGVDISSRYLGFEPSCLSGIILGCNFPTSLESHLSQLQAEREALGYPEVRIYRADVKRSHYGLRILRNQT